MKYGSLICQIIEPSRFKYEDDVMRTADRLSAENFLTLADLCNRRQHGSCQWILDNPQYRQWSQGSFRSLYCLGPGMLY